jgi:hypothetical protein
MTSAREIKGCSGKVTTAIARDRGVNTKLIITADRVKRTFVKDFLIHPVEKIAKKRMSAHSRTLYYDSPLKKTLSYQITKPVLCRC